MRNIIQDLFINVMKLRERCNGSDNFDYIKNLNYDEDVKQKLKGTTAFSSCVMHPQPD